MHRTAIVSEQVIGSSHRNAILQLSPNYTKPTLEPQTLVLSGE